MKTGLVMVISAVTLFTGTVVWAAFKKIPHPVDKYNKEEIEVGQAPDRVTANTHFFESEAVRTVYIDVPFPVELDNSFEGVELTGDTSLFQYVWISTSKNPQLEKTIRAGIKTLNSRHLLNVDSTDDGKPTPDFQRRQNLRDANLKIRVGIRSTNLKKQGWRSFYFNHCKKISTVQPLQESHIKLNFFLTDSLDLHIDSDQLTLDFPSFSPQPNTWAQLKGRCRRVAMNNFFNGSFDASGFTVDDFYVQNIKNATVKIHAAELARVMGVEDCQLTVEGNPKHKWIDE